MSLNSLFHTFRVYVKNGAEIVYTEDCDLHNVQEVLKRLHAKYPKHQIAQKAMQAG